MRRHPLIRRRVPSYCDDPGAGDLCQLDSIARESLQFLSKGETARVLRQNAERAGKNPAD